ncbi:hypothetical protein AB0F03_19635 [Streptomyces sp. NPDC028722]|uniref:hypothetical protein n=1 Tax=Streptomyces sp. NPDC028722 TaxID=3155016 RepID=UPI0033D10C85
MTASASRTGFSATVLALGIGTLIGPATLGAVADRSGLRTAFLVTAALTLVTLAFRPPARQPDDAAAARKETDDRSGRAVSRGRSGPPVS